MQSTMNPISPVGRAVLPTMQGASPDEINQLAADAEKSGLLSFADALGIKRMADMISKSGAQDPRTQDPRRKPVVQELRDAINAVLNPPAAPPAMNAGVASLPMPDDMYADVGMAGGGIVAFSGGGQPGPYQPPQRVPYGESYFGKYIGVPIGGFFSRIAESLAERQLNEADLRRQAVANIFGGELPPAAPVEQSSEIRLPTTNQEALEMGINPMGALASRTMGQTPIPRTPAPTAAAPGATSDLRPGDKAPPPALRGAPPAPTGPTAPTGIAALIPKPDLKAIQKEVDKSYRGLKDVYTQREASLTQREDELEKLLDTSQSESLMDFGIRLMKAGTEPGTEFVEALGTAGQGYREARKERQKELFEAQNRLKDAQFEVNAAKAQFDVDRSDKSRQIYENSLKAYSEEQKRVQELQQAERDRQDKRDIYGIEIEKTRLARGISDIDERLFGMAKDDPLRTSLLAQRESLMGTLNTLIGDSYTNDIRQQQLIVQATDDIKKTPEYEAAALSATSAYNSLASLDPEDDEEEYKKAMDRYTAAKTRMDEILKTGLSQLGLSPLGGSATLKPEDIRRVVGD